MNEARVHLRAVLQVAVSRVIAHVRAVDGSDDAGVFERFPVLGDYAAADVPGASELPGAWHNASGARLPLHELDEGTGLGFEAQVAMVLAGCVEEDLRLGSLFAELQAAPAARRPCIGLLEALTDCDSTPLRSTVSQLMELGWLVGDAGDAPRAERIVRLPPGVWDVLQGALPVLDGVRILSHRDALPLRAMILDAVEMREARQVPRLLSTGRARAFVVRGPEGAGRRTLVRGIARALRVDTAPVEWNADGTEPAVWRAIGPACQLARIIPVALLGRGAPGQSVSVAPPPAFHGFVAVVAGRTGGVRGDAVACAVHLDLSAPGPRARAMLWRRALPGASAGDCRTLGERFRLTAGNIGRVAALARARGLPEPDRRVDSEDVRHALRAVNRHAFESLAQYVPAGGSWDDLCVPATTRSDLLDLQLRCRFREALPDAAATPFGGSLSRGVRALFAGPSGTGKTLAARVLAAELRMELYRVDLSSLVDKYIGQTEKNLNEVLSKAEDLDVMLLLDEGDSLMSGRTDVRSSNDRYANLETNYLLQRLESFDGVLVITTNAGQRIDTAFLRRLDATVDFPPPAAVERERIWAAHLPAGHGVSAAFLHTLAARAALTGGQIRNAALHATLVALERGAGEPILDRDLEMGARREFRKSGSAWPGNGPPVNGGGEAPAGRLDHVMANLR